MAKKLGMVLGVLLLVVFAGGARGVRAADEVIKNPIVKQRADSHVYRHTDGFYYFMGTVPEFDRLELRRAKTLSELAETKEAKVIWKKHETGQMASHIWAPEIHFIEGKWYVYFAAGESPPNVWRISMFALENESANPLEGEWKERGQVKLNWNAFALDFTTFVHKGQRYGLWAERDPAIRTNSNLYIAKMDSPTTIVGRGVKLSQPELAWEIIGFRVNEGPAVLHRSGKLFMTYSASATDANYCMGMLTAEEDADLLKPESWKKSQEPVLKTTDAAKVFGPGHNSFTTSADGKTDILIFHARDYKEIRGDPLNDPNRNTRAQVITYVNGVPIFMPPVAD